MVRRRARIRDVRRRLGFTLGFLFLLGTSFEGHARVGHAVDIDVENMVIRRITSLTVLLNQYWCRYIRPHLWQHHAELFRVRVMMSLSTQNNVPPPRAACLRARRAEASQTRAAGEAGGPTPDLVLPAPYCAAALSCKMSEELHSAAKSTAIPYCLCELIHPLSLHNQVATQGA